VWPHVIDWLAGGVLAWVITHVYYRRGKRDADELRALVERAVADGIVIAQRNAAGQIQSLSRPLVGQTIQSNLGVITPKGGTPAA